MKVRIIVGAMICTILGSGGTSLVQAFDLKCKRDITAAGYDVGLDAIVKMRKIYGGQFERGVTDMETVQCYYAYLNAESQMLFIGEKYREMLNRSEDILKLDSSDAYGAFYFLLAYINLDVDSLPKEQASGVLSEAGERTIEQKFYKELSRRLMDKYNPTGGSR